MVLKITSKLFQRKPANDRPMATFVWGLVALVLSALYLASTLHLGWVPHDTGQLGHTAERVLGGELQHRDFDEPYTGALGHLHALAFQLLGVRAESMRWVVLVYALLMIPATYCIALRVTAAWVASLVALLCAALTLPIYSASMPSWYNLFFMLFGVLTLLKYHDTGRRRWLFWAGCCAGCSLAVKITGLYFVATALLYLAFRATSGKHPARHSRNQALVPADSGASSAHGNGRHRSSFGAGKARGTPPHNTLTPGRAGRETGRVFSLLVIASCVLFGLLGCAFSRGGHPVLSLVHFTLPLVAVSACLAWQQWRYGRGTFGTHARRIAAELLPLGLGISLVISLLLVPYLAYGALGDLYRGLFVLPALRMEHAALAPPDLKWMSFSLPLTGLLTSGMFRLTKRIDRPLVYTAAALGCVALLLASGSPRGYFYLFQALRNQTPLLVFVGSAYVAFRAPRADRPAIFLLLTAAALGSLVQYPYAYGTYFFYAAPLVVLATTYIAASQPWAPKPIFVTLLLFTLVLAVWRLPQPDPRLMNGFYDPDFPIARVRLARCNLQVYEQDATAYRKLVGLIESHSLPGDTIYAAPDCPEVYFLSGRRNPTRTFYDLFEGDGIDRQGRLNELLDRRDIHLVVINHHPAFSTQLQRSELDALQTRFAHSHVIRGARQPGAEPTELFTVFWNESAVK